MTTTPPTPEGVVAFKTCWGQSPSTAARWTATHRPQWGRKSPAATAAIHRAAHLVLNKSEVDGNTATAAPRRRTPYRRGGASPTVAKRSLTTARLTTTQPATSAAPGIVNHGAMTLNKSEVNGKYGSGERPGRIGWGESSTARAPPGTGDTPSSL